MTPRPALLDVCAGRAICISFFRPDDVEAAEAISPAIMFRQWSLFILESSATQWAGMGRNSARLVSIFRMARRTPVSSWKVGGHTRHSWSAKSAQRCITERLAFWAERCATLAYGWAYRASSALMRPIRQSLPWLDRSWKAFGQSRLSQTNGGSCTCSWESMARTAYDARNSSSFRLSFYQRGQYIISPEWMAV